MAVAIVSLFGIAAAPAAWAFGFGPVPESVVFGRTLDLTVPLRMNEGPGAEPGCLFADVQIGERRLPAAAVRVQFLPADAPGNAARLRVYSTQAVDEPVVAVQLRAGCSPSAVRRFVVFADPEIRAGVPAATLARPGAEQAPAAAAVAHPAVPQRPRSVLAVARARHAPAQAPRAASALGEPGRTKPPQSRPDRVAVARLKLDEPELSAAAVAAEAALRSANEAAVTAGLAASAAVGRVAALDKQVQVLRSDAAARQAALEAMRARLAAAQQSGSPPPVLIALSMLLGAAVLWLGWRLRGARRTQRELQEALDAAAPVHAVHGRVEAQSVDLPPPITEPLLPDVPAKPLIAEPSTAAVAALLQEKPATVEDLLDLEQQAEFFMMLGQDDAAVELLMTHLRGTGGTSPLPYLKLLEIHRQCDDHDAYERLRARFNRRFNAYAPEWAVGLDKGLPLLGYPQVTASLQALWSTPSQAMAELQALLYRKGDGDLFDLPAYRDLLMLYAVARDLAAQGHPDAAGVDVLLPVDHDEPRLTQALISSFGAFDTGVLDDRPTLPVDLDLSDAASHRDGPARVTATLAERV